MLDSRHYLSSRDEKSRNPRGYIPPELRRPVVKYNPAFDGWGLDEVEESRDGNKQGENRAPAPTRFRPADAVFSKPDARAIKAPSSLASSTYHAQGYMPQYDRAGYQSGGTAYHSFMPQKQGTNGHHTASHALPQSNPNSQYGGTDSRTHQPRNHRYGQGNDRDARAGYYGKAP